MNKNQETTNDDSLIHATKFIQWYTDNIEAKINQVNKVLVLPTSWTTVSQSVVGQLFRLKKIKRDEVDIITCLRAIRNFLAHRKDDHAFNTLVKTYVIHRKSFRNINIIVNKDDKNIELGNTNYELLDIIANKISLTEEEAGQHKVSDLDMAKMLKQQCINNIKRAITDFKKTNNKVETTAGEIIKPSPEAFEQTYTINFSVSITFNNTNKNINNDNNDKEEYTE